MPLTQEIKNKIYKLRKEGLGYGSIAKLLNTSREQVRLLVSPGYVQAHKEVSRKRYLRMKAAGLCHQCGQPLIKKQNAK